MNHLKHFGKIRCDSKIKLECIVYHFKYRPKSNKIKKQDFLHYLFLAVYISTYMCNCYFYLN